MPLYLVHYLDAEGRGVGRFEFHCINDAEAELACEELGDARPHELWCGRRWMRTWATPLRPRRYVQDNFAPPLNNAKAELPSMDCLCSAAVDLG